MRTHIIPLAIGALLLAIVGAGCGTAKQSRRLLPGTTSTPATTTLKPPHRPRTPKPKVPTNTPATITARPRRPTWTSPSPRCSRLRASTI
jgi:hypothetical protein